MKSASLDKWTWCVLILSLGGEATQTGSTGFVAGLVGRHLNPIPRGGDDRPAFFIGYLSGVLNQDRREYVRKHCIPALTAKGWDTKFLIGQPTENLNQRVSTSQGQIATPWEQKMSENLRKEAHTYGDILPVPYRDLYRDLGDKTLALLQHAKSLGVGHVLKIDDDRCPNATTLESIALATKPNSARYIGAYLWKGNEYKGMIGPDNQVVPYFGGPIYIFSAALVSAVLDDPADTVWWFSYGTSSEDKVTGQWFEHAKNRHPELRFTREIMNHLTIPMEGGAAEGFKG